MSCASAIIACIPRGHGQRIDEDRVGLKIISYIPKGKNLDSQDPNPGFPEDNIASHFNLTLTSKADARESDSIKGLNQG